MDAAWDDVCLKVMDRGYWKEWTAQQMNERVRR